MSSGLATTCGSGSESQREMNSNGPRLLHLGAVNDVPVNATVVRVLWVAKWRKSPQGIETANVGFS
jgi:hypothetical protein